MIEQKIHTVVVSYQRVELTLEAIRSYLETVTLPFTLLVVDNGSDDRTVEALTKADYPITDEQILAGAKMDILFLPRNVYPGPACNLGFGRAPDDATLLHRADNDFRFLPGWCDEVLVMMENLKLGQLGLRTDEEEQWAKRNVGGNAVFARELWDAGLRYDERPWSEYDPGYTEDSLISPAVRQMGYRWARVQRPCIEPISVEDPRDPYYRETWGVRRIHRELLEEAE
jgi:glycosyltransferase involved in cell wall biosynthesis